MSVTTKTGQSAVYNDSVVRWFAISSVIYGVVGMLVGVIIALLVSVGVAAMEPDFPARNELTMVAAALVLVTFHRRSRPAKRE